MPQTLLALCGIVVATFLTLQSQRHRALSSEDVVQVEVTQMGAQVAMDVLNGFRALPFDEAAIDEPVDKPASLHNHLPLSEESSERFKTMHARREVAKVGLSASATIATLDHADGRTFMVERSTVDGTVRFRVEAVVGYVESDGETISANPTKLKVATIRVTPILQGGLSAPPLLLSQLYACGSGCSW